MKRRTFLRALGIGVSICFLPEIASAETPVVPELPRYRALFTLPSHGDDDGEGGFRFGQRQGAIREGDVLERTGELGLASRVNMTMERLYNITRDRHQWFMHHDGFWSDTKHLCRVLAGPLPTWFERIS